jgi:spore maturation protein CgeB
MKLTLLNTNGIYSHAIQYNGIKEALKQIKQEDEKFDFIEKNIVCQDDGEIEKYNPDFIFCITPLASGYRVWRKYRGRKVIIFETEGLYECANTVDNISYCDYFATVDKKAVEYFKSKAYNRNPNCKFFHMPLGFSSSLYRFQDVPDNYKSDVCFAGAIFDLRRQVIHNLVPLKDKIKFRVIAPRDWVGRIMDTSGITYLHGDYMSPEEMVKHYCGSKNIVCINRDYDPANDSGLESTTPGRVFQETATRRLVMIDNSRPEIHDYFEDGKEIVVFDSENPKDIREKILYYLNHDQEREAIAHNGYIRTMKENTWKIRIKKLLNFVKENEKQI